MKVTGSAGVPPAMSAKRENEILATMHCGKEFAPAAQAGGTPALPARVDLFRALTADC